MFYLINIFISFYFTLYIPTYYFNMLTKLFMIEKKNISKGNEMKELYYS